ncbi:2138_t:CDS:1, partial [Racocetra persica]
RDSQVFREVAIHNVLQVSYKNHWVHIKTFKGEEDEDLVEWVEAFERAANANN